MFYIGKDDTARQVSSVYVGVNGVARQAVKAYIGVNGVARLCWGVTEPAAFGKNWRDGTDYATVTKLTFTRAYTPTGTEDSSWVISTGVDGSVMGYRSGNEVTIAGDNEGQLILESGYWLFKDCDNLAVIEGLELLDVSKAGSFSSMFAGLSKLASPLDLSSWNVSGVTEMQDMFDYCYLVPSINLAGWDTSNCTRMDGMFAHCKALTALNLSSFVTNNVTYMNSMFYNCDGLTSLDLTSFDTNKVIWMDQMFQSCDNLTQVLVSADTWKTASSSDKMFYNCGCSDVTYV